MIKIEHVTFTYKGEQGNSGGIRNIDLTIPSGQFVVLCGESGCGKTTLTRLLNGLIPHYYEGELTGKVTINEKDISRQPLYETAKTTGSVFQNPRSQFFNVDTTGEITFGCENLGWPPEKITENLHKVRKEFKLDHLLDRNIFQLSGGEKQKIACAGVSIMEPDLLILDEPSSNLDASSILELQKILSSWKKQGKTVVISEHRLYYLRGLADRILYMKDGQICKDYPAAKFEELSETERRNLGLRTWNLEELEFSVSAERSASYIELQDFQFSYKKSPKILHISDQRIPAGGIIGIIGNNGAGKSTFSRCFCGLEKCGKIHYNGKIYKPKDRLNACYMVMQDVNHQLFTESVEEEIRISMENEDEPRILEILEQLDLGEFRERHPMSLSGGQKQRTAIATALASRREILFMDEPTSGLDLRHMLEVSDLLKKLHAAGHTIYVITHDLELLLECCTDVLHFQNGSICGSYSLDESGIKKIRKYFLNSY